MEAQRLLDEDVHFHTPAGRTGIDDMRSSIGGHGRGAVADATATEGPARATTRREDDRGEIMNENIDNKDKTIEVVDGYTDTEGESEVSSPDPGSKPKLPPLDPEEYAKAQREARTEEHEK